MKNIMGLIIAAVMVFAITGTAYAQAGIVPPDPPSDCMFKLLGADITPADEFSWRVSDANQSDSICQVVIFDYNGYRTIKTFGDDGVYDMNWAGDRLLYATKSCADCYPAMTVYFYQGIRLPYSVYLPLQ